MKYLGVDFGLKRIGLAISEGWLASPLKVIEIKSLQDALNQVMQIVKKEGCDKVVVGLPEGKTGKMVHGFINGLRKEGVSVWEADETLSTQYALQNMILANTPQKKRRVIDDTAAAIILQNWLDLQKVK